MHGQDKTGICGYLDVLIWNMSVEERNDRREIDRAEERTISWYDRLHREDGPPMPAEERAALGEYLRERAPDIVAKRNARSLLQDLSRMEEGLGSAALPPEDEKELRRKAAGLIEDLLIEQRYRKRHDQAIEGISGHVRKARSVVWAERCLNALQRYTSEPRWWLGQGP